MKFKFNILTLLLFLAFGIQTHAQRAGWRVSHRGNSSSLGRYYSVGFRLALPE